MTPLLLYVGSPDLGALCAEIVLTPPLLPIRQYPHVPLVRENTIHRGLNVSPLFTVLHSRLMSEEVSIPAYSCTALPSHPTEVSSDGVADVLQSSYTAVMNLATTRVLDRVTLKPGTLGLRKRLKYRKGPHDSNRRSIERAVLLAAPKTPSSQRVPLICISNTLAKWA